MKSTFALPDGQSAVLRDPASVTERHRRPVTRLQMRVAGSAVGQLLIEKSSLPDSEFEARSRELLGGEDYALLDELNDALIVALVESWTFEGIPVTLDGLLDLPGPAYDALKNECGKQVTVLMPSFEISPDETSPTPPSAGSDTT